MRRNRGLNVFSLSFLDIMSCGFGAVILFFMIINATVARHSDAENAELLSETDRLELEVLEGRKDLVKVRNVLETIEEKKVRTEGEAARVQQEIEQLQERLAEFDLDSLARREAIEQLRADVQRLQEQKKRLLAAIAEQEDPGNNIREFRGEGDRQYLTGLKIGGDRALILVDTSASMLDRKVVNIIRRRNMSAEEKLKSAKWRQVVASVDWIMTQFREGSQFQVYMFNETVQPVISGSEGVWLQAGSGNAIAEAIRLLRSTVPNGGTNLEAALEAIGKFQPRPDNVYLLIDSLPTTGGRSSSRRFVTGIERQRLLNDAVRRLPSGIPVNVLLYPMEGDYAAPIEYWKLAYRSRGSFMAVSTDWP